jgi:POLQ-like helicase
MVELGEQALGFEGSLLLGAMIEMSDWILNGALADRMGSMKSLQKCLRYGVAPGAPIHLHEMGLSDRIIAGEVAGLLVSGPTSRRAAAEMVRERHESVRALLRQYPTYFQDRFEDLVGQ